MADQTAASSPSSGPGALILARPALSRGDSQRKRTRSGTAKRTKRRAKQAPSASASSTPVRTRKRARSSSARPQARAQPSPAAAPAALTEYSSPTEAVATLVMPRRVPWASWSEWAEVGHQLLATRWLQPHHVAADSAAAGLRRVAAWHARGGKGLPVSVSATSEIVDALARVGQLHRRVQPPAVGTAPRPWAVWLWEEGSHGVAGAGAGAGAVDGGATIAASRAQALGLAMAVVRFVNGISDAAQRGAHAASVATLVHTCMQW